MAPYPPSGGLVPSLREPIQLAVRRILIAAALAAVCLGVSTAHGGGADTTRFLVVSGDGDWIASVAPTGIGYRRILDQHRAGPAATRNGAVIAVGGPHGISLYNLMSGTTTVVGAPGGGPVWSGDESQLAFGRQGSPAECTMGFNGEIWAVFANGADVRKLLGKPFSSYGSPAWSPDGTWLVYDRVDHSSQTCAVSAGMYAIQLSNPSDEHLIATSAGDPAFAPHSDVLAYFVGKGEAQTLRVANLDAAGLHDARDVLGGVDPVTPPLWSPDGTQVAVQCKKGSRYFLCMVTPSTGAVRYVDFHGYMPFAWVQPTPGLSFPLGRANLQLSARQTRRSCVSYLPSNEACWATYRITIADTGPDALTSATLEFRADSPFYANPGDPFLCLNHRTQERRYTCGESESGYSTYAVSSGASRTLSLTLSSARGVRGPVTLLVHGDELGTASVRLQLPG